MSGLKVDQAEVLRELRVFTVPGQVVELRAPKAKEGYRTGTISGYFDTDHLEDLAKAAAAIVAPGIYYTINPPDPDLLARCCNRARMCGKDDPTTSDKEIVRRIWFYIDCDAVRKSGISATDAEKAAALEVAQQVEEHLTALTWPAPVLKDSGNGYHLCYRVDLPAEDGGLVGKVLGRLNYLFGTGNEANPASRTVKVDPTVANPSRITKISGTPSRKGDSTPNRPHRMARLLSVPESIQTVPTALLESLVSVPEALKPFLDLTAPAEKRKQSEGPVYDVAKLLEKPLLATGEKVEVLHHEDHNGGHRWTLAVCPYRASDGATYTIIQFDGGGVSSGCSHGTCDGTRVDNNGGKRNDWPQFKALFGEFPSDNAGGVHPEEAQEPSVNLWEGDESVAPPKHSGTPLINLLITGPELARMHIPPRDMIVAPFIATGSINMVTAPRGLGKTFFGMELCRSVTLGQQFFEWHVPVARDVIFLDGEMPTALLQERFGFLYGGMISDRLFILPSEALWTKDKPLNLNDPESQARVQAMLDGLAAQGRKPDLIIVDNISSMSFGVDENDNSVQDSILQWLMGLRHQGYAILLVHHTGKNGAQRGASRREDFLDTSIMLSPVDGGAQGEGAAFKIEFTKERGHKAAPSFLNVALEEGKHGEPIWTRPRVLPEYMRALLVIYQHHPDTATDLGKKMDISRQAATKHIEKLREKGFLHPVKMAFTPKGNKAVVELNQWIAA